MSLTQIVAELEFLIGVELVVFKHGLNFGDDKVHVVDYIVHTLVHRLDVSVAGIDRACGEVSYAVREYDSSDELVGLYLRTGYIGAGGNAAKLHVQTVIVFVDVVERLDCYLLAHDTEILGVHRAGRKQGSGCDGKS